MVIAVKTGKLDVVQCLYSHELLELSCEFMYSVAEHGHLDIVKWLHEMEPICSMSAIVFAANLEIVKWLHYQAICGSQRRSRRLWHHEHGSQRSIDDAASNGDLAVVQWLHNHRPDECSVLAMDKAANRRHIGVVHWFHANSSKGCAIDALCQPAYMGSPCCNSMAYEHRKECKQALAISNLIDLDAVDTESRSHCTTSDGNRNLTQ